MKGRTTIIGASALLLACAIVLTSCAEEPESVTDELALSGETSTSSAKDAQDDVATPDGTVASDPGEAVTAEECLIGTWRSDNAYFAAGVESYGGVNVSSITGDVNITFETDGTRTIEYVDWSWTAESEGQTMVFTRSGTDLGEWSVASELLTMRDTELGTTINIDGPFTMSIAPEPDSLENIPFTCDGDTATFDAHGHTHPLQRLS